MHAHPDDMRDIGERLTTIAGDARGNVSDAAADVEAAGVGNEGFLTVAAAKATAETWLAHVREVAGRFERQAEGLVRSANEIQGTDVDGSLDLDAAAV
jgi:hypothetical protein